MIDGSWSRDEIVEAFWNGTLEKFWPKMYEAIKFIIAEHINQ